MAETVLVTISTFVIRELTGQKRTLRLAGRALPYKPFRLEGGQRHDTTWYPGGPVATQQVLGAMEKPTTIRGKWKERFIGASAIDTNPSGPFAQVDGEPIGSVSTLVDLCVDMRRQGQRVEVTWLDRSRRGLLSNFVEEWETPEDAGWEMEFTWMAIGNEDETEFEIVERVDLSTVSNELQSTLDEFDEGGAFILSAAAEAADIAREIDTAAFQIQSGITAIEDTFVQNIQQLTSPVDAAQRSAGILDFTKATARNLENTLTGSALGVVLNAGGTFGELLSSRKNFRDQCRVMAQIKQTSAESEVQARKNQNPQMLRVFVARQNQDLREVSSTHYGTPDEWRGLLTFNKLSTSKLDAGQLIFVPRDPPRAEC